MKSDTLGREREFRVDDKPKRQLTGEREREREAQERMQFCIELAHFANLQKYRDSVLAFAAKLEFEGLTKKMFGKYQIVVSYLCIIVA